MQQLFCCFSGMSWGKHQEICLSIPTRCDRRVWTFLLPKRELPHPWSQPTIWPGAVTPPLLFHSVTPWQVPWPGLGWFCPLGGFTLWLWQLWGLQGSPLASAQWGHHCAHGAAERVYIIVMGVSTTLAPQAAHNPPAPLQRLLERKKEKNKKKKIQDVFYKENAPQGFSWWFLPPCRLGAFPASLRLVYMGEEQGRCAMKDTPHLHHGQPDCHLCVLARHTPHVCKYGRLGRFTRKQHRSSRDRDGGHGCAEIRFHYGACVMCLCRPLFETVPRCVRHVVGRWACGGGCTQEGICAIFTDYLQAGCGFILPLHCQPPAVCGSPEARHHLPAQPQGKAALGIPPPRDSLGELVATRG